MVFFISLDLVRIQKINLLFNDFETKNRFGVYFYYFSKMVVVKQLLVLKGVFTSKVSFISVSVFAVKN